MRWARLFADLEAQLQGQEDADLASELASRTRYEVGQVTLSERLRATMGYPIRLTCPGIGDITGQLQDLGPGWLLLDEGMGRDVLVNLAAVQAIHGVGQHATTPAASAVSRRLDLRYALRGLARDRCAVQVLLSSGQALCGTFDRVGADYVELAEHMSGDLRRAGAVRAVAVVALSALSAVRTLPA